MMYIYICIIWLLCGVVACWLIIRDSLKYHDFYSSDILWVIPYFIGGPLALVVCALFWLFAHCKDVLIFKARKFK